MKKSGSHKQFTALCAKYLSKSISKAGLDELSELLKEPENEALFKEYIRINYALDFNLTDYSSAKSKLLLLSKVNNDSIKKRKIKIVAPYHYAVAASIAALLCLGIYLKLQQSQLTDSTDNNSNVELVKVLPGSEKAILTLENGQKLVLNETNSFKNEKAESDGKSIVYNSKNKTKEIAYNELSIPRGGEFFIQLADGTKVWLNSESKLKYPINFEKGKLRKVELLYGEAYFDVSSSEKNKGARFRVVTQGQEIEVLGTEFNIKAYKSDNFIATTLIEGRVAVTHIDSSVILKPAQQAIVINTDSNIVINTVDVDNEIAWKNGFFSFEKQSLSEILKILSRWYDVTIVYEDEAKKNFMFSGVLKRTSNIKELLINIEKTERVVFEIEGKTIMIK